MRSRSYAVSIRIACSWDGLHDAQRLDGGIAGIPTFIGLLLAGTRSLDWNQGRRRSACGPDWMIRLDNVGAYHEDMLG